MYLLSNIECIGAICRAQEKCNNQHFLRPEKFKLRVELTANNGFGFFTENEIPADTFITQYVGDVIGRHEFLRRFNNAVSTAVKNFYFFKLGDKEYIDATSNFNSARYINHSCSSNAMPQKWDVFENGQMRTRIGIFSLRKIDPVC